MVRINLLPPEILQKRRAEKLFGYIFLGGVAVLAILVVVSGVAWFIVRGKAEELQSKKTEAEGLRASAEAFKIFETKESDLEKRKSVVGTALSQRIDWAKVNTEMSLVLPTDMWVTGLGFSQDQNPNYRIDGQALDPDDTPDTGHKTIAKALIRLADLEQLYNVWLAQSEKSGEGEGVSTITFQITADVVKPAADTQTQSPSAPAPPAPPAGK